MTAKLVKTEAVVEGRTEVRWTLVEEDDTPEFEDGAATRPIGEPTPRITARARTTGSARFTVDIALPGLLEAAVLRSPHANARVTSLDLDAARAVPGVRAVIGPGEGPENGDSPLSDTPGFAGAAIAAVAADSADAAEAALAALAPEYEVLGFVTGIDEAFEKHDFLVDPTEHERGDPDAALAAADITLEASYIAPAQLHNSLEPHAAVADWRDEGLVIWSSTQAIYDARATVAEAFGLDPERVRVICEFMGGGFGSKFGVGPQGILAAELSRRTRRPVRLVNSRREENITAGFRTPAKMDYTIGASADGRLQAVEASAVMGMGSGGWAFPVLEPVKSIYACPNVRLMVAPVRQNLGPSVAFRAPGVMEGTFGFEQALDELAEKVGIDPLDLRRLNHSEADPESGKPYSSKHLLECYDRAAELAGWAERDALRGDGRIRRGMGAASQYWWGGGGPPAYAEVRVGKAARPAITVGLQDLGTGTMTACAVIASERLGIPVDAITVYAGDTSRIGHGPFSGGSMTLASIAPAVRSAAHHVRTEILGLAAEMFEIAASDLTLEDGEIRSVDGTLRQPITEVTGKLGNAWISGSGSRGPNPEGMNVNTFGCQIAQVAVDTGTGRITVERIVAVHDIGRVVNPMGARSQVMGGILQGIGFTLMEERVVDPTTGTVVNAGLEDYKVPTIADLPEVVCEFVGDPDPHLKLGVKGLGEPPVIPTPGAIGNAVAHALGVRLREAPYTPRRVLEALGA
ncbi:MAG TPA: xanthine dehydrogenase family protein molybdopterin-binding subunit [Gaiellales bacterium]|jgi:CO/xanthine dehydrogenase Mo-binding subunit|nr:xanthine dehydrogenase family protein molybdopterin-binding subunit [Gaiellales bacterium]